MPDKQPNIVFLLCDNVGWGDFSCYGGSTPTPRIDKLAGEGVRFTNYTVESQCTPSRSAILIIFLPILGTIIYLLARPADAGASKRRHNHRGRRPGRPAARPAIHPLEERI